MQSVNKRISYHDKQLNGRILFSVHLELVLGRQQCYAIRPKSVRLIHLFLCLVDHNDRSISIVY